MLRHPRKTKSLTTPLWKSQNSTDSSFHARQAVLMEDLPVSWGTSEWRQIDCTWWKGTVNIHRISCVISCLRRAVNEICALLRRYAAFSDSDVSEKPIAPTFKSKVVQFSAWTAWSLKMVPIGCPETPSFSFYCLTLEHGTVRLSRNAKFLLLLLDSQRWDQ